MKIIYLTTAVPPFKFAKYLADGFVLNPSNQIFHNKLIKAISQVYEVDVVTSPSIYDTFKAETVVFDNIPYHFCKTTTGFFGNLLRYTRLKKRVLELMTPDSCLVCDSLNLTLMSVATACRSKKGAKLVAVCTDLPENLSNVTPTYVSFYASTIVNADAFITLTPSINEVINVAKLPSLVLPSLAPMTITTSPIKEPYFLFAGSTLSRYGVFNLIKAFHKIEAPYRLIIAGFGSSKEELIASINENPNITYVGLKTPEEITDLQSKALATINPRPYTKTLDDYAIPSKVVEQGGIATLQISTMHTTLYNLYTDTILWCGNGEVVDLETAMRTAISLDSKKKDAMIKKMNEITIQEFGIDAVAKKIKESKILE
jgi:glycosyltransferase involved in cell wall biosynthesis